MTLYLSLLGPPQLLLEDKPVTGLPRKAVTMAAYLAVVGNPVERGQLADLLWEGGGRSSTPESSPGTVPPEEYGLGTGI